MRSYVVTGGCGFLGGHVVKIVNKRAQAFDVPVCVLDILSAHWRPRLSAKGFGAVGHSGIAYIDRPLGLGHEAAIFVPMSCNRSVSTAGFNQWRLRVQTLAKYHEMAMLALEIGAHPEMLVRNEVR